jgi:hypothetical protein
MKKYRFIQTVIFVFMALLFDACTSNFDEINTSNSLVTEDLVDVNLLLTRVQAYAVHLDAPLGNGTIGNYSGMNARGDNQPFADGDAPELWNNYYQNYSRNLSDIIHICQKRDAEAGTKDLVNKIAIARIMKVWATSVVTDTYGDIPYTESCLPVEKAITQPKYDAQKDIYKDMFKELKEAVAQMDAGKASYGAADLIYGGNVAKWTKLANSLRLRLAMRVRYTDEALAKENLSDLTEEKLIVSLNDDAFIKSATDFTDNQNKLYTSMKNNGYPHPEEYVGKTITDIMIGSGDAHHPDDPRIALYCDTAYAAWPGTPGYENIANFGYRGAPLLGLCPVEEKYPWGARSVSRTSAFWFTPVIERPLLRSSEVYFALAEAALFGLKSGNAEELYRKGIDQAIAWAQRLYTTGKSQLPDILKIFYSQVYPKWNSSWEAAYFADKEITAAEISAFKTKPAYSLTGTTEQKLEQIMNQKIIALFPDENQGWFEWRRTGYPRVLVGSDDNVLKGVSPRRMRWPQIEQTVNSESYKAALARIGGTDGRLVRVWWDANSSAPHAHPGKVPRMDHPWVQ